MSRINVENIRHPDAASDSISLNSSARVGVGTSSPQRLLHLNGGAETVKLQITNTSTGSGNDGEGFQIGIATDGTANIEQRENQDLVLHTNNTERLRILANGTIRLNNTSGIDFSQIQTNAPGMTSETLDSYEEGTFTPSLTFATPGDSSFTYTTQAGFYTKVGRLVHYRMEIRLSAFSKGTASGDLRVSGLPFTTADASPGAFTGSFASFAAPLPSTAGNFPFFGARLNDTVGFFKVLVNNSGWDIFPDPDSDSQYKLDITVFTV